MKKKIGIILGISIIVIALGFLFYACAVSALHNHALNKTLEKITFVELQEKVDNKETFILVYTQESCSHCQQYKPVLKEVLLEHDLKAYEIDISKVSSKDKSKLKDIANADSTPTTIFIANGQEHSTTSRIVGAVKKDSIISRLKAMGYIKTDKEEENN